MLHRTTCPDVKHSATKATHWTTGHHMKACSLDAEELKTWAREQTQTEPAECPGCMVAQESHSTDHPLHLTKLGHEILSFVLEIAALHLDDNTGSYWLSVGMVGKCLDKTPAQLSPAIQRLVDDGMLTTTETAKPGEHLSMTGRLFPTIGALKTLSAFQDCSDQQLRLELSRLVGAET
jgi:hypothetical protein